MFCSTPGTRRVRSQKVIWETFRLLPSSCTTQEHLSYQLARGTDGIFLEHRNALNNPDDQLPAQSGNGITYSYHGSISQSSQTGFSHFANENLSSTTSFSSQLCYKLRWLIESRPILPQIQMGFEPQRSYADNFSYFDHGHPHQFFEKYSYCCNLSRHIECL